MVMGRVLERMEVSEVSGRGFMAFDKGALTVLVGASLAGVMEEVQVSEVSGRNLEIGVDMVTGLF